MTQYFNQSNLAGIVARRASSDGLDVQFSDKYALSNGKVVLEAPKLGMSTSEVALSRLQYIEGPARYKRFNSTVSLAKSDDSGNLSSLWAMLESDTAQKVSTKSYKGDLMYVGQGNSALTDRVRDKASNLEGLTPEQVEQVQDLLVCKTVLNQARTHWDSYANTDTLLPLMSESSLTKVEAINTSGIIQRLADALTSEEVRSLSIELEGMIWEPEEDKEEEQEQEGEGEGEGNSDDGTGEMADELGLPSSVEGEQAKASEEEEKEETPTGVTVSPPAMSSEGTVEIIDLKHKDYGRQRIICRSKLRRAMCKDSSTNTKVVSNRVRKYLLDQKRTKIQTNRKQGKLHNRNVGRIAMPMLGDGSWNSRVFKRKIDGVDLNTSVTILIDCSGSMAGNRITLAGQAALVLVDVFSKVMKIPVEILGFTATGYASYHGIVKDFTDRTTNHKEIASRL